MAWSVNDTYGFLKWLVRKNQTGLISTTDFFYAWNAAQYSYHDDLVGKWQRANVTKEGANIGLIQSQVVTTKLLPFTLRVPLTITGGLAQQPADLIYTMALRINGAKVFKVQQDQIWAVNDDIIDPPSVTDNTYYYSEYADGTVNNIKYFSILPTSVTEAELDYVAACTDVVWAYTLDPNGRQVYDAANSVQCRWNQNTIVEITKRTLKELGVSFSSGDFEQYGQSIIQTGD